MRYVLCFFFALLVFLFAAPRQRLIEVRLWLFRFPSLFFFPFSLDLRYVPCFFFTSLVFLFSAPDPGASFVFALPSQFFFFVRSGEVRTLFFFHIFCFLRFRLEFWILWISTRCVLFLLSFSLLPLSLSLSLSLSPSLSCSLLFSFLSSLVYLSPRHIDARTRGEFAFFFHFFFFDFSGLRG
ncbi:hypothetical protein DFJ73DRAFT_430410 [Zopfochytrium polystomum]|nr:hypothetical protein DFJ73DRAFT_430410 [Zopfochytrium polystomum]